MSMIGKSLAHYSIISQIGKGGMGEVYQAKDQKLGREVAIKVLPEEFARDHDRVARFQREAKLLASLNHPNIASIYGLEESDGTNFLVMELIEGETLADRISASAGVLAGKNAAETAALPGILKIALQIAEALEAAHEKGVIHRDLKPANIKVTPEGKVKVLDFGLAKAFEGDPGSMHLSNSPTLSDAATQQGVILGTAAYMPPEQAKGKSVDKRADIWAFGVVLFEMLAGRQLFSGDTVSETLAAVLMKDPDFSALPANLNWKIREMLERCLEKDPRNRYSGISDARVDIQKVLANPRGMTAQAGTADQSRSKLRTALPWVAGIILAVIAGAAAWNLRSPEPRQVMRFDYELPEGQQLSNRIEPNLGVSPDGRQIVYCTPEGLYLRSVDALNAKLIPGSDRRTQNPFFSPDGKSIAYFSQDDSKLKKIAIEGGAPTVLCGVEEYNGGSWAEDFIVYGEGPAGIKKISSNGGTPETLFEPKSEILFDPQLLPDGKAVLYTVGPNQSRIMAKPLNSEEPKELFAGWFLRYLPSGHMVYWDTEGNLCTVPFDSDRLEAAGERVSMIQGVDNAAVSDSGTLIYTLQSSQGGSTQYTLVWVDRAGKEEPLEAPPNEYDSPRISPDGKQVALLVGNLSNHDIWIWDIGRKNLAKLTLDETDEMQPVWTPDSKRIIYYSNHENATEGGIYWRAADGSGNVEKLISASDRSLMPWSLSGDGKTLLMQELVSWTNADIGMLSMEGDRERKPLLQNEYSEAQPTISPDGRWMAYLSSEAAGDVMQSEIYLRPFPAVEESKKQVSAGGGFCPLWSPDGKELFYLSADNSVMAVTVKTEPTFSLTAPAPLFKNMNLGFVFGAGYPWGIHPDGKRFLMLKPPVGAAGAATATGPRKITIVLNWDEELKRRAPVD